MRTIVTLVLAVIVLTLLSGSASAATPVDGTMLDLAKLQLVQFAVTPGSDGEPLMYRVGIPGSQLGRVSHVEARYQCGDQTPSMPFAFPMLWLQTGPDLAEKSALNRFLAGGYKGDLGARYVLIGSDRYSSAVPAEMFWAEDVRVFEHSALVGLIGYDGSKPIWIWRASVLGDSTPEEVLRVAIAGDPCN